MKTKLTKKEELLLNDNQTDTQEKIILLLKKMKMTKEELKQMTINRLLSNQEDERIYNHWSELYQDGELSYEEFIEEEYTSFYELCDIEDTEYKILNNLINNHYFLD